MRSGGSLGAPSYNVIRLERKSRVTRTRAEKVDKKSGSGATMQAAPDPFFCPALSA
jgi:hypothetical protein